MVMMPFFLVVFAVIEVGMQMGAMHSVTGAVKAGSRSASAAGNDLTADYLILQSIKNELAGMPSGLGQVSRIVVYKSGGSGQEPSSSCRGASSGITGACNVYTVADLNRPVADFGCKPGSPDRYWCPGDRKTALTVASGGPPGYIGIYIVAQHETLVSMVGQDKTLTDHSVNRLEPSKR